jgi:hypothetical protein
VSPPASRAARSVIVSLLRSPPSGTAAPRDAARGRGRAPPSAAPSASSELLPLPLVLTLGLALELLPLPLLPAAGLPAASRLAEGEARRLSPASRLRLASAIAASVRGGGRRRPADGRDGAACGCSCCCGSGCGCC